MARTPRKIRRCRRGLAAALLLLALEITACGGAGVERAQRAIIGGLAAAPGELLAVGALVRGTDGQQEAYCTGTLVADRLVLTAGHCLTRPAEDEPLAFFVGEALQPGGGRLVPVVARRPHERFVEDPPQDLTAYDDVGLAMLGWAPPGAVAATLVEPGRVAELVAVGRGVLIAGFGLADPANGQSRGVKRTGETSVAEVAPTELRLWGAPGPQRCAGDSGGPSFADLDQGAGFELQLIGVASRTGTGCEGGSAETRVDAYLPWLTKTAESLGCDLALGTCRAPPLVPRPPPLEPIPMAQRHAPPEQPGDGGCSLAQVRNPRPDPCQASLSLLLVALLLGWRRRAR